MIAREEKLLFIEENCVTTRVTRRRNSEQIVLELDRVLASQNLFDTKARGAIISVHDSFAAKLLSKQFVIGDVVLVR